MNRIVSMTLFAGILFVSMQMALAQQPKPKYTGQDIYDYFAQYTAEEIVAYAQEAVKHYTPVAQAAHKLPLNEEQQQFDKALREFTKKPSKWSSSQFPLLLFITPQRCDEGRAVAHIIPGFLEVMGQKNFAKRFRDVTGRLVVWELCEKIRSTPEGVWVFEKQWWPETDRPIWIGFFLIQIPDTPYQLEAFYPTLKYFPQDVPETQITEKEVKIAEKKINDVTIHPPTEVKGFWTQLINFFTSFFQ